MNINFHSNPENLSLDSYVKKFIEGYYPPFEDRNILSISTKYFDDKEARVIDYAWVDEKKRSVFIKLDNSVLSIAYILEICIAPTEEERVKRTDIAYFSSCPIDERYTTIHDKIFSTLSFIDITQ